MDTLGLIIAVVVSAASVQDRDGANLILWKIKDSIQRLCLIWGDGAYAGKLIDWVEEKCGWKLEIHKGKKAGKGFVVRPWLWIVERTFAWLGRYRRLSKDYEYLTETSEAMIYIAMIHLSAVGLPVPKADRHRQALWSGVWLERKTWCNYYSPRDFSNTL